MEKTPTGDAFRSDPARFPAAIAIGGTVRYAADVRNSSAEDLDSWYEVNAARARKLICAMLIIALVIFLFPLPNDATLVRAAKRARTDSGIQVTGNSVISHVSACDIDKRPLPEMLGAATGLRSSDSSFPGQPLEQGIGLAGMALSNNRPGAVVLFASLSQMADVGRQSLQTQSFFRIMAGPLATTSLNSRLRHFEPVTAGPRSQEMPFSYDGTAYPSYDRLKVQYMLPERNAQGCPETLGKDRRFIEALYWANYLRNPIHQEYLSDFSRLQANARRKNKRLLIVLLPIDFADVDALNPKLSLDLERRRDALLARAKAANVTVLDLSGTVPAEGFADRWCGCGHLQAAGRRMVASRVAVALNGRSHAL